MQLPITPSNSYILAGELLFWNNDNNNNNNNNYNKEKKDTSKSCGSD